MDQIQAGPYNKSYRPSPSALSRSFSISQELRTCQWIEELGLAGFCKKATKLIDVKRYLKDVVIAADNLFVVRDHQRFQLPREGLAFPRSVLEGLLTALHARFSHLSKYQTSLQPILLSSRC